MPARVLIIDDMKSIRDVLRVMATKAGMQVCATAVNGRAGVELAQREQPDVIMLDQEMPVLDGLSALPLLLASAPGAKVVMFSSADDPAMIDMALNAGATAYFTKGDIVELMKWLIDYAKRAAELEQCPPGGARA